MPIYLSKFLTNPRWVPLIACFALMIAAPTTGFSQEKEDDKPSIAESEESSPGDLISDIQAELKEAVSDLAEKYSEAETEKEQQTIVADRRELEKSLVDRTIEITRKRDNERANIKALGWFLAEQVKGDARTTIFAEIESKYLESKELPALLKDIAKIKTPAQEVEDILRLIAKKNSDDRVQGITTYSLVTYLEKVKSRTKLSKEKSKEVEAQIESLLNECVSDHAEVEFNRSTVGKLAASKLTQMNLKIGKVAPDIVGVDLDDKEFKLSDYRGKVVVIDFWGDW